MLKMKKSVLNWMGRTVALLAISIAASTAAIAQSVESQFVDELKLYEGLKVYNNQLAKQLEGQKIANTEIAASISEAGNLEPQVVPVLNKMLASLEAFVKADLPFHVGERTDSIDRLKDLMVSPDAKTSDRFRNIMDIYTAEIEYGNTYEAYKETLPINGNEIEVDMLRIGRVALYYQTRDQKVTGMWDRTNNEWKTLDASYNRNVRKAIKVAAKTVAPELLSLLIEAPEAK